MNYRYLAIAAVASLACSGGDEAPPPPLSLEPFEGYVIGSDSAPVTIVEYADFQCPACRQHAVLTMPDVLQRYVATGKVKWVFKDFPLDIHPNARTAHLAAACAADQGRFMEMHDQLFYGQNDWSQTRRPRRHFDDYAEAVGLDAGEFDECMDSRKFAGRIEASVRDGVSAGVGTTPTFIIEGRVVTGTIPFDQLASRIEALLPEDTE